MKKANKQTISYDKESKVLSIKMSEQKSIDSDISNNIVIDYDKNKNVVRVNFYDFSFEEFRSGIKAIRDFAQNSRVLVKI